MANQPRLLLLTALLMFPQVVETLYSPALPAIADAFKVSAQLAGHSLSLYFIAFAFGVVFWGRLADTLGRRPAMLAGLACYGLASLAALVSQDFALLLSARALAAFGAAAGSIVTQTMLRDCFEGRALARVFALAGIALALSPALGMMLGATLVDWGGYLALFAFLLALALLLLGWSAQALAETAPDRPPPPALWPLLSAMAGDGGIWRTALLVALFNLGLFSYYQLAPFVFDAAGLPPQAFGYSGLVLALGAVGGALCNRLLLGRGWAPAALVRLAVMLFGLGALGVAALADHWLLVLPMVLVVLAFGLGIPNVLAGALTDYGHCLGTAGALLGMAYYLLLGTGLVVAAWLQDLGPILVGSALTMGLLLAAQTIQKSRSVSP
ncbi:MFS transporter [Gallaecimonas xiamenensis]|uniref:Major facilitator superfamily (MFS) profile domain-containing protein n=1 Tax=Gallaecimonas xiamenensis 3-C-1 TaxID=745411 RepID=K2IDJ0_9GAMM|nr:MFS transporter [Gallaecimonas xiamenensis]EKE68041.1 hypothetical protein B3C1_17577 [Gallaecimonas xiamenensis 3-C-1]